MERVDIIVDIIPAWNWGSKNGSGRTKWAWPKCQ